jgi:signal transduction histidine kinase
VSARRSEPGPRESAVPVDALELFVAVLSRSGAGEAPGEDFYGSLCGAICRIARMRRAIIFRYDPATRRVHAAGAHEIDIGAFSGAHVTVESAPIAAQALAADDVIEATGDLRRQFPPEFASLVAEPMRLVCAPMLAADRAVGVILADRPLAAPPLEAGERHLLWTLGKAAALATVARFVSTEAATRRELQQRIDLARDIHERVIQRLFGVSMVLDMGEGPLPAEVRKRCAGEIQAALGDLREALQRPLGRAPASTGTTLVAEVERLAAAHPELGVRFAAGVSVEADCRLVPEQLEPLAQSVLREAVRNAQKHARPTAVEVWVGRSDGAFVLEVVNDGVREARHGAGMGLRLAAFEAMQYGGVVEFGERDQGSWQVRLVVPEREARSP